MDAEKIKLLFLVYPHINTCTNPCTLCQNLFEWLVLVLVIVFTVKYGWWEIEGRFLKMEENSALMELNLTLWVALAVPIIEFFSRPIHLVWYLAAVSVELYEYEPSVPLSMNIFSSPPTGPCILVLLYNYPKTMVIQHHPAILLQGAIRNLTNSIQITWDGHSWSRSVAFTCNA